MVPLKKLRKVAITEDFRLVYTHYVEKRTNMIEKDFQNLINLLSVDSVSEKALQINKELKSQITLQVFTDKVIDYFLRILYVKMHSFDDHVSINSCVSDAINYATSEYLTLSLIKSVS